jgi:hypothetical protein
VALKCYFDCGNHADSSEYDRISVGLVCGTREQWRRFDPAWNKILYKHGADFLHTTDAVSLQNEFSKDNGWDKTRVDALIWDCVDVIEKQIVIPEGVPGRRSKTGLFAITLTIPFADWVRAKIAVPELPETIEELCATESLSFALRWGMRIGTQKYQLFYDRGENLYGYIHTRWTHPKAKKDIEMMKQIIHVGESSTADIPALQMADLFAWSINRANQEKRDWHRKLHDIPFQSALLDYDHLINPRRDRLEQIASWGLPPRRSSVKNLTKPKK